MITPHPNTARSPRLHLLAILSLTCLLSSTLTACLEEVDDRPPPTADLKDTDNTEDTHETDISEDTEDADLEHDTTPPQSTCSTSCSKDQYCFEDTCYTPPMIALGSQHSCTLANNKIKCWGYNKSGQIGTGDSDTVHNHFTPQTVSIENEKPVKIFAGGNQTCTITANKSVYCWGGHDSRWQPGAAYTFSDIPEKIIALKNDTPSSISPIQLALDDSHSCVRFNPDSAPIRCIGNNSYGQLGNNTNQSTSDPVIANDTNATRHVVTGSDFSCAVYNDNKVACWGSNDKGQLAQGSSTPLKAATRQFIEPLKNVVTIEAGAFHACAILKDKTIQCWGFNSHGQLGVDTDNMLFEPTTPHNQLENVKQLALGHSFTCALLESGEVFCTGNNANGQLGTTPSTTPTTTFTRNEHLTNVHQLFAGSNHLCAIHNENLLSCWGHNAQGQLAHKDVEPKHQPIDVQIDD